MLRKLCTVHKVTCISLGYASRLNRPQIFKGGGFNVQKLHEGYKAHRSGKAYSWTTWGALVKPELSALPHTRQKYGAGEHVLYTKFCTP